MISKQISIDSDTLTIDEIGKHLKDNLTQYETIPAWGANKNSGVIVRLNESFGALVTLNSKKKIIKIQESLGSLKVSFSILSVSPKAKEKLIISVYNLLKEKYSSKDADIIPQQKSNVKFTIGLVLTLFSLFIVIVNISMYYESGDSANWVAAFLVSILGYWGIKLMIKSKRQ